ncbi:uncharacterized protein [Aegilops tauschii subsp. strangulata]|uniref:Uncharacterized protein n=1 Tax=Aegilops tauschii subsp. strangulata TaxID=200361 RepID=A0A453JLP8_AEGTS|nr:uncharacterized protein LOC109759673 [Aegilops tauschii subsp. strangulata]XP_045084254.1 uncharacterized protein LOC109759673 [Aegilops tauschii subsp. strangulata]
MDGNDQIRDPLLATVPKEETIPAAVQRASGWALFTACCGTLLSFAAGHAAAYAVGQYQVCSTQVGLRNYTRLAGFCTFRIIDRWIHPSYSSWLGVVFVWMHTPFVLRCVQWTDAQAAENSALWFGMLCCALLQAAAAALARHLPCRDRWVHRALAYLALVVTFVGHFMYAAAVRLLLAVDPGCIIARIFYTANIVIFAGGDLICFLGLLLGGDN